MNTLQVNEHLGNMVLVAIERFHPRLSKTVSVLALDDGTIYLRGRMSADVNARELVLMVRRVVGVTNVYCNIGTVRHFK